MARSAPSRRETAPALTSARTSRSLLAPPESVVALVFSLRLTHYPRSLWIGEYFRGSLELAVKCVRIADKQEATVVTRPLHVLTLKWFRRLFRQLDSIWMLSFAFVLLGKNFYEP